MKPFDQETCSVPSAPIGLHIKYHVVAIMQTLVHVCMLDEVYNSIDSWTASGQGQKSHVDFVQSYGTVQ